MTRPLPDDDVRRRVTADFDTTFLLEAGAGTGKTSVLVARLVALVRAGRATLDRVVAITFTEKAAAELKQRLRESLEEALEAAPPGERERLERAGDDLERAHVSTVHAFCSALLRERPFEAGLDPGFQVAAEVAGDRTFDEAWDAWLDRHLSAGEPLLVRALHLGLKLDSLRRAARALVSERDVLAQRVAVPAFDPDSLLEEARQAVKALRPLKASCLKPDDGALQAILALETDLGRLERLSGVPREEALRNLEVTAHKGAQAAWKPKEACAEAKSHLRALKEEVERYVAASDAHLAAELRNLLCGFAQAFEDAKREAALADFQDLLLRARDVLQRSLPVRRYFQGRFDYLLLDEFQDTDPLQVEVAFLLCEDPAAPAADDWRQVRLKPGKLFLVGDPKQSIYRFRRADLGVYEQAKARVTACGGEVLALRTSFRTVPSLLHFVNERFGEVFVHPGDPQPIALEPWRDEAEPGGARVVAVPVPDERLPGTRADDVRAATSETLAALIDDLARRRPWTVVDRETRARRPARPGDVAVLLRTMAPGFLEAFERACQQRGLRHRVVGGKRYYGREEVQALTATLQAIDNPADRLSLVTALRSPFFGLSDDDLFQFTASGGTLNLLAPVAEGASRREVVGPIFELLGQLHRQRRVDPPSAVLAALLERTRALPAFLLRPAGEQKVANLWKLLDTARAYEAAGPATLRGLARFLGQQQAEEREEADSPVGEEVGASVRVMTVHAAKGLEFPIVALADLAAHKAREEERVIDHAAGQGWLKIGVFDPEDWADRKKWERDQQEAEERRLLYVALTRARDHLVLPCLPAPVAKSWLAEVEKGLRAPGEATPAPGRARSRRGAGVEGAAEVTWFDPAELRFEGEPAGEAPRVLSAGSAAEVAAGRAADAAWEQERRAWSEAARVVPPPKVTVTEKARGEAPGRGDGGGPALGRLVHELLARAPLGDGLDGGALAPLAAALAGEHGLGQAEAREAAALAAGALALPFFEPLRAGAQARREWPFACPLGGEVLVGVIDLAFETADGWAVVDYKTDEVGDPTRAAQAHAEQVGLYCRALTTLTGRPARGHVCFVRAPAVVEVARTRP